MGASVSERYHVSHVQPSLFTYTTQTLHPPNKLQDLRGRLDAALEQVDTLRDHLQERDTERRELEQKIQIVRKESQEAKKDLEESLRDSNRHRCSLELMSRYFLILPLLTFIWAELRLQEEK